MDLYTFTPDAQFSVGVQQYVPGIDYRLGASMLLSLVVPQVRAGDFVMATAEQGISGQTLPYNAVVGCCLMLAPVGQETFTGGRITGEDVGPSRPYFTFRQTQPFDITHDMGDARVYLLVYAGSEGPVRVGDAVWTMYVYGQPTGQLIVKRWRRALS